MMKVFHDALEEITFLCNGLASGKAASSISEGQHAVTLNARNVCVDGLLKASVRAKNSQPPGTVVHEILLGGCVPPRLAEQKHEERLGHLIQQWYSQHLDSDDSLSTGGKCVPESDSDSSSSSRTGSKGVYKSYKVIYSSCLQDWDFVAIFRHCGLQSKEVWKPNLRLIES